MFRKLKYAWQRAVRGYDDTIFWQFDAYFGQFIPAIKKFAQDKVCDLKFCEYNPDKALIFKTTLDKIKEMEDMDFKDQFQPNNKLTQFWAYFGEHIAYFWS